MRKRAFCRAAVLLLALALLLPVTVDAAPATGETVTLPELGISLTLPEGYGVTTGESIAAHPQMPQADKDIAMGSMERGGIYLLALPPDESSDFPALP